MVVRVGPSAFHRSVSGSRPLVGCVWLGWAGPWRRATWRTEGRNRDGPEQAATHSRTLGDVLLRILPLLGCSSSIVFRFQEDTETRAKRLRRGPRIIIIIIIMAQSPSLGCRSQTWSFPAASGPLSAAMSVLLLLRRDGSAIMSGQGSPG